MCGVSERLNPVLKIIIDAIKVNSKKKKVNNFNIFFLKFFLSSIYFRAKKTITIKGTIIPRTLVAIKIDEESDDKNKFL